MRFLGIILGILLVGVLLLPGFLPATSVQAEPDPPPAHFACINNWVGTGYSENQAALLIDWRVTRHPQIIAWGYRWDGVAYGEDMFRAILAADKRLHWVPEGFPGLGVAIFGIGYDLDGDNDDIFADPADAWPAPASECADCANDPSDHYSRGWFTAGFWSYWLSQNGGETWEFSPLGISSRVLSNGDLDGWSWAGNFMTAPPSSTLCNGTSVLAADFPQATDISVITDAGTPTSIDILANVSDPNNTLNPGSVSITRVPENGSTSVNTTTGVVIYTPDNGFSGEDSLVYRVCNTANLCDSDTITITVTPAPPGPSLEERIEASDRALEWLASIQTDNGGIGSQGPHIDSMLSFAARGIPVSEWPVSTTGNSMVDYLRSIAPTYANNPASTGKTIAGIVAAGEDPRNFAGVDFVARLYSYYDPTTGRFNPPAYWSMEWGVMGLKAAGEPIPDAIRSAYIAMARPDGCFGQWSPSGDDVGFALMTLAALGVPREAPVVQNALNCARNTLMNNDGGFRAGFTPNSNSNSTAFMIMGLLAVGEDPLSPAWTVGNPPANPYSFILSLQQDDGRIWWQATLEGSALIATHQSLPAILEQPYTRIPYSTPIIITPTNTPTATNTATSTPTNTPTATNTATSTPTNTPTATNTATSTPTNTPTATNTATSTSTNTPTTTLVPPTNTPTTTLVPPTNTPTTILVPPTNTPTTTLVPPTNTPTTTLVPPTNTPTTTLVPPTNTPTTILVPPTNTPTTILVPPTNTPTTILVPPTNTPTTTPDLSPEEPSDLYQVYLPLIQR